MLRITNLLVAVLLTFAASAQISMPAASPAASVSTTVGLTDVTIDYFRPKVKGRQIFGEGDAYLQPYGTLWRTGANSGTTITLSTDAKIAGTDVKAGTYMIISTPGADEFEVVIYSDPSIGGAMSRVEDSKKVLTTKVKTMKPAASVEALTFQITDISADNTSANVEFSWENASWKLPIEVNYDEMVMADIEAKTQVNPGNLMQAAGYYLENGKDLNKALEWATAYMAIESNQNQYWNLHTKAQIEAALGMKKEAIATAEASIEAAKARNASNYVKMNEELIKSVKKGK